MAEAQLVRKPEFYQHSFLAPDDGAGNSDIARLFNDWVRTHTGLFRCANLSRYDPRY
jgi:hypothetical protein